MTTKTQTMTTQEVADRFFELAQQGAFDRIQDELYDENISSGEPAQAPRPSVEGIGKVKEKAEQWKEATEEMHGGYTGKPQVAGKFFTCTMGMDVTIKGQGRITMDEVAV